MVEAFERRRDVLYLVPGSPLFVNDAVFMIRRFCASSHRPLRLVHGLSFLDCVLDRVFWTGHGGLQYSSGRPAFSSLARQVKLGSLAKEPVPVPVYSNLWVPGIAGPRPEAEVAPPAGTHETPHPSLETTPRS